jgi:hypothetical protein
MEEREREPRLREDNTWVKQRTLEQFQSWWKTRVNNSWVIPKLSFKERWWSAIREQQQFLRYLCKISARYCKSHETILIKGQSQVDSFYGLVLPISYLSTNIRDQFLTELVTKVKSNINSVEVHLQLSNNGHPLDSALMGAGSFRLHARILAICSNIFGIVSFPEI